ncbi:hypothetical protein [Paractinoplanes lichenicola]|uniref:Uncharacterized protein n=1 Tax=Paractinoplanes lichenicola TaxID=2802976 RepID=A0ABS1VKX6_9ACTN|nr:hypothetical protein [Actinoplanes lichenicola]MBL7255377.1 hypothetical protein [Actinoplanes lichenicola]
MHRKIIRNPQPTAAWTGLGRSAENARHLDAGIPRSSYSDRSDPALELIHELALEYGLTIWDPQNRSVYRPVRAPSREDVEAWWRDLLDGRSSRSETHERVRLWVEDPPEPIADPITLMGLQHLHGFGLTDGEQIQATFDQWIAHCERFDADPAGWQRDRYLEALKGVLREQGTQHAWSLADRLTARGWVTPDDVAQVFGSPAFQVGPPTPPVHPAR